MAAGGEGGWISGQTSLKPFTYPVPETRFLHAGVNVYKFKIKYGHTISINTDHDANVLSKELQDAIRVVLGNLDNLCPFTTEHLIIFPCEREYRNFCISTKKRNKLRAYMDTERATKQRKLEDILETSHTQQYVNRNSDTNAIFMYDTSQPDTEFGRNQSEEMKYPYCSSSTTNSDYNIKVLGQHVETNRTKNAENNQQERCIPTLQNRSEQRMELKKKGFLGYLKSALFPLFLQQVFSGNDQAY